MVRPKETGTLVGVRLQAPELGALDAWRKEQADLPTRPEAVRRLLAASMAGSGENPTIELLIRKLAERLFREWADVESEYPEEAKFTKAQQERFAALSDEDILGIIENAITNKAEQIGRELLKERKAAEKHESRKSLNKAR